MKSRRGADPLLKPQTYHFVTLGCRANQADSGALQRRLQEAGYRSADAREAELIFLNTCTVTHRADQDARRLVRHLRRLNPEARLIVTGCYVERDAPELAAIPGIDEIVRKQNLLEAGSPLISSTQEAQTYDPRFPKPGPDRDHTRPFVKIQDGCDCRCAYCIVPSVRGPARSLPPDIVLDQVADLIRKGFQEIVLTGIHLGCYGRKLSGSPTLAEAVQRILQLPGLGRLRLSGVEPMEFSNDLIALAAGSPLLAPHFHLPLQSGSAETLQRMRRPYSPEDYRNTVQQIQAAVPDVALGTDILVGLPGETEEQHRESLASVRELPLHFLHVFSYSPRPGTPAASWKPLPDAVVRRRSEEFHQLADEKRTAYIQRFLGRCLRALTLRPLADGSGTEALTGNYLTVRLPGTLLPANLWVEVRLEQADSRQILGRIAHQP